MSLHSRSHILAATFAAILTCPILELFGLSIFLMSLMLLKLKQLKAKPNKKSKGMRRARFEFTGILVILTGLDEFACHDVKRVAG